jgi:hypothetical protein
MNHEAIRRAYPQAVNIDDGLGAFDAEGNQIELDQTLVDAAETEINTEASAVQYKKDRKLEYPDIGDQLDALFHAGVFPTDMAAKIQAVKDKYPKPTS